MGLTFSYVSSMQWRLARTISIFLLIVAELTAHLADLGGHKLLVTSVRTGDPEVFIADPTTGG